MAQQRMFLIIFVVAAVSWIVESRVIPSEPVSISMDPDGNPMVLVRAKRAPIYPYVPYPHRAMMFTGYYRPVRRSPSGAQGSGVYAQGNAVSGEAFFGGGIRSTPHLRNGPEPIEEPEISSTEAEASPEGSLNHSGEHLHSQGEHHRLYHNQGGHRQHHQGEEHQHESHHHKDESECHQQEEEQNEPEPEPETTPAEEPTKDEEDKLPERPTTPSTEVTTPGSRRTKGHNTKKNKKRPVYVEEDEDEEDEEDEDGDDLVPFVPMKGNRRRQGQPNLNNFFPMVFTYPGASTRAGSSGGLPPDAITAIANSYSTKGGVASSVATAYGVPTTTGKKRRAQPASEE